MTALHLLWDASASAKRYAPEMGSDTVDALLAIEEAVSVTTVPGYAETFAILLRKHNAGAIGRETFLVSLTALETEWLQNPNFVLLSISDIFVFSSLALIRQHNLNSSDAAILATFLNYRQATLAATACCGGQTADPCGAVRGIRDIEPRRDRRDGASGVSRSSLEIQSRSTKRPDSLTSAKGASGVEEFSDGLANCGSMKHRLPLLFCAAALIGSTAQAKPIPPAIQARYDTLIAALKKFDFKTYESVYAPEFVSVDPKGKVSKRAEALAGAREIMKGATSASFDLKFKDAKTLKNGIVEVAFDFKAKIQIPGGWKAIHEVGVDSWKKFGKTWMEVKTVDKVMEMSAVL